ncbi:MAG: FAD binding domain-containing protein [Aigarchaeota archaeon]|nr:FAD binding domain-containing protein [Candidatus Pelearchaeum maunauluense]
MLGYVKLPRLVPLFPRDVMEAVQLRKENPDAEYLAGGTALIPLLKSGAYRAGKLIDLSRLKELRYIRVGDGVIRIGPLATHADITNNTALRSINAFQNFAKGYTSPAVMNSATVGGSIAIASHTEDLIPILLALNTELTLLTPDGGKLVVELEKYVKEHNKLKEYLILEVAFKLPASGVLCDFEKLALGISRIPLSSVAVRVELDRGRVNGATVAVAQAYGTRPGRVREVEELLKRREITEELIGEAANKIKQSISPPEDTQASSWYRRELAASLFTRIMRREVEHG